MHKFHVLLHHLLFWPLYSPCRIVGIYIYIYTYLPLDSHTRSLALWSLASSQALELLFWPLALPLNIGHLQLEAARCAADGRYCISQLLLPQRLLAFSLPPQFYYQLPIRRPKGKAWNGCSLRDFFLSSQRVTRALQLHSGKCLCLLAILKSNYTAFIVWGRQNAHLFASHKWPLKIRDCILIRAFL